MTVVAISGGTFNYLAKSLSQLSKNFNEEDEVILIADCNDCSSTPHYSTVEDGFNVNLLREPAGKTNLLVVIVPLRYDRHECNYRIKCVNGNMQKKLKSLNVKIISDITSFDRKCFNHSVLLE